MSPHVFLILSIVAPALLLIAAVWLTTVEIERFYVKRHSDGGFS